jgi:hypothetical protein
MSYCELSSGPEEERWRGRLLVNREEGPRDAKAGLSLWLGRQTRLMLARSAGQGWRVRKKPMALLNLVYRDQLFPRRAYAHVRRWRIPDIAGQGRKMARGRMTRTS